MPLPLPRPGSTCCEEAMSGTMRGFVPMAKFRLKMGEDHEGWVLDLGTMLISEAESCESMTGWDAESWRDALAQGRARAVKFAVWLARTRAGDSVAWADLDFDLAALLWELLDEDGNVVPPSELGVTEEQAEAVPTGLAEQSEG